MDLVSQSAEELGDETELASVGIRPVQIHPDIYMNELLQGMRTIHQVLPAIMKKLGIKDFKLDESELSLPVNALGYIQSRPVAEKDHKPEDEQMPSENEPKRPNYARHHLDGASALGAGPKAQVLSMSGLAIACSCPSFGESSSVPSAANGGNATLGTRIRTTI
jgi:hypothetical protein